MKFRGITPDEDEEEEGSNEEEWDTIQEEWNIIDTDNSL